MEKPVIYTEKYFDFLYNLSISLISKKISLIDIYAEVIELIPTIWQNPDTICAKLVIEDQEFTTRNYRESKWQQQMTININGDNIGHLIVGTLEKPHVRNKNLFSDEENKYLKQITEWLAQVTKRSQIKSMIKTDDIKFRTLVDDAGEGIFICNLDGTFIYANRALANTLGYSNAADVIGKGFDEFLLANKKKQFLGNFKKSLETGRVAPLIETKIIREDGTTAITEIKPSIFVIFGKIRGIQGVVRDITELKKKEEMLMVESTHDSLTGIFNNSFFEAEMKRLEKGRQFPISVIVIDLDIPAKSDSFYKDNPAEHKLIKRVAHKLFSANRGDDIIARIGVTNFAILLPGVNESDVSTIAQRIQNKLHEETSADGNTSLKFHLGISTAKQGDMLSATLKHAFDIIDLSKKKEEVI